jgi:hypothetical protein
VCFFSTTVVDRLLAKCVIASMPLVKKLTLIILLLHCPVFLQIYFYSNRNFKTVHILINFFDSQNILFQVWCQNQKSDLRYPHACRQIIQFPQEKRTRDTLT